MGQWFGTSETEAFVWDVLFAGDSQHATEFALAWNQLAADILPFEVCVDQMCREITRDGRCYELDYKEVCAAGILSGILVTIKDVTERAAARRAALEAEEALAILANVLRDARGFGRNLAELGSLARSARETKSVADARRTLHTLKGNAAVLGLMTLNDRCHKVEDTLDWAAGDEGAAAWDMSTVDDELAHVLVRVHELAGEHAFEGVEIPIGDLTKAIEGLARGKAAEVLAELRLWTLEPVGRQLNKLAARARRLATKLEKDIEVVVDDGQVRVDSDALEPLWGALAHAVANAVDHGIESEEKRIACGKPARGRIVLSARSASGGGTTFEVSDDGGGVDLEALRAAAMRLTLPCATRSELLATLFADRLSTRNEVSTTSGRGVGLASLRETCVRLGATLGVETADRVGTRFRVDVPFVARSKPDVGTSAAG